MTAVALVCRTSVRHALPHLPDLHTHKEDVNYFSTVVFDNNQVFVAVDTECERIQGFIAFNRDMVNHLYLLPEATGQGLGGQLLDLAKQQGGVLQLWTFQCNEVARKFYAKHGFKVIKETDGADNDEKEPDVLFEWSSLS